jgi:hypothetical protein
MELPDNAGPHDDTRGGLTLLFIMMVRLNGRKGSTAARRERHLKLAENRASQKPKCDNVFGQVRRPAKMFRAGLYARVSTNDQ